MQGDTTSAVLQRENVVDYWRRKDTKVLEEVLDSEDAGCFGAAVHSS